MNRRSRFSIGPRTTLRHFGAFKAVQQVVLRILGIRPVLLMVRGVATRQDVPNTAYQIRRATNDDVALFLEAGFKKGTLEQKLDEGPGWICVADGHMIAWNFLSTQQSVVDGTLVLHTTNPTAIWGTGTWVRHDFRGHGLASEIRARAAEWCRDNGYNAQIAWINFTNFSSLRASRKLGGRQVGRIIIVKRFGFTLVHDGRKWHRRNRSAERPLVLRVENICELSVPRVQREAVSTQTEASRSA